MNAKSVSYSARLRLQDQCAPSRATDRANGAPVQDGVAGQGAPRAALQLLVRAAATYSITQGNCLVPAQPTRRPDRLRSSAPRRRGHCAEAAQLIDLRQWVRSSAPPERGHCRRCPSCARPRRPSCNPRTPPKSSLRRPTTITAGAAPTFEELAGTPPNRQGRQSTSGDGRGPVSRGRGRCRPARGPGGASR